MLFLFGSAAFMLLTSTALVGQATQNPIVQTPFGFQIGQPKGTISNIDEEVGPHRFLLASVPKPDLVLEVYSVVVTPKAGLCSIRALSPELKTTPVGTELKSVFDKKGVATGTTVRQTGHTHHATAGKHPDQADRLDGGIAQEGTIRLCCMADGQAACEFDSVEGHGIRRRRL